MAKKTVTEKTRVPENKNQEEQSPRLPFFLSDLVELDRQLFILRNLLALVRTGGAHEPVDREAVDEVFSPIIEEMRDLTQEIRNRNAGEGGAQ